MLVMSEKSPDLSIILQMPKQMPSSQFLKDSLRDIQSFFNKLPISYEVIIAGQCPERTSEASVKSAMLKASGEFHFLLDSALSIPLAEIIVFLAHFRAHPEIEVLVGSRNLNTSKILFRENTTNRMVRQVMNRMTQKIFLSGLDKDVDDAFCKFKAFRKSASNQIFKLQRAPEELLDIEVLMLAQSLKQSVDILPIRWTAAPAKNFTGFFCGFKLFFALLELKHTVNHSLKELLLSQGFSQD